MPNDKTIEERLTSVEFLIHQLTEKINLYIPYITELQKVAKLSDDVDNLKERYSKISQRCVLEKDHITTTRSNIKDLVESINSINNNQVEMAKELIKLSSEVNQIKKDIQNIEKFIQQLQTSGWRIIERFGPYFVILLYMAWQIIES